MTDPTTVVDTYLSAYGEPDPARRAELIEQAFVPDASLVDPPLTGEAHEGIDAMAHALQQQFAGHTFRWVSTVEAHHNAVRYAWELVDGDGTVAVAGMDVGQLADDGRLVCVTGFFGALQARDGAG